MADTPKTAAEPKPGYKTTEGWISAAAITGLLELGPQAMWPVAVIAVGYAVSRALAKRGA